MDRRDLMDSHRGILTFYHQRDLADVDAFWGRWRNNTLTPEEARDFSLGRFYIWGVPKEGPRVIRRLSPGE